MIDDARFAVTLFSALGCGLMAGVFFAFSAFVMEALGRLPPSQGMAAMQSINVAVINPLFLSAFLGTAVAWASLAVSSLVTWPERGSTSLLAGSLLYLVGTFLVTMVFNVPRNDALAAVEATSADAAALWAGYLGGWTAWNHVRTAAALGAAASLTIALRQPGAAGGRCDALDAPVVALPSRPCRCRGAAAPRRPTELALGTAPATLRPKAKEVR